jgi:uncharacterized protein
LIKGFAGLSFFFPYWYILFMNTREEIIALLRSHLGDLRSAYGVLNIGLFGSFARGNPGPESDVDIVVEFDGPIGMRFMEFVDHVQALMQRRVDILTPAGIAGIRNKEIAQEILGSIVYV